MMDQYQGWSEEAFARHETNRHQEIIRQKRKERESK